MVKIKLEIILRTYISIICILYSLETVHVLNLLKIIF